MRTVTEAGFRRSPWGRKKHLLPLPILSVLLMVTAMASPNVLRMTVVVFDDTNLTISATIQNVVHPSGTSGTIVGIMRVTNHDSMANRITVAMATFQTLSDGSWDGRFMATISIHAMFTVPAGATVTVAFSGPFTGSISNIRPDGDSFLVTPSVTWSTIPASGPALGPFSYSQSKTCTVSLASLSGSIGWNIPAVCS